MPRITAALVGALLVTSGVVGCASGDEPATGSSPVTSDPTPSPTPAGAAPSATPSPTPYLDVPSSVDLTDQGASLAFGESATVAWEPRKRLVGALDVTVRAVERAPMSVFRGWRLTPETRASAAYFVRAQVENVGDTDLSGLDVPLYAVDETNTLIQASTFASRFAPCPSTAFPGRYRPGERARVCLVFLVPDDGDLTAVSFRPTQAFDPITWTGEVGVHRPDGRPGQQGQGRKKS